MALSLKDYGIGELFWKALDEVVALVYIICDLCSESELVECGNIFCEFLLSLTEIYDIRKNGLDLNKI